MTRKTYVQYNNIRGLHLGSSVKQVPIDDDQKINQTRDERFQPNVVDPKCGFSDNPVYSPSPLLRTLPATFAFGK